MKIGLNIITFLKANKLSLSIGIFIGMFCFSRLPFFIWMPIPYFSPDDYEYFSKALELKNGILPDFSLLPPGYSFFIYISDMFSDSILTIVYLQNIICLLSAVFFIWVLNRYYTGLALISSAVIAILLTDGDYISLDCCLLPDSLYRSSLIVLTALFILAIKSEKKQFWLCFSLGFIFPCLLRSNGPYIFLLAPVFWLFLIRNKYAITYQLYFIIPLVIFIFLWSGYNYVASKEFKPFNYKRIEKLLHKKKQNLQEIKSDDGSRRSKLFFASKLALNIYKSSNNLYYNNFYERWASIRGISKMQYSNDLFYLNCTPELKKYIFREFNDTTAKCNDFLIHISNITKENMKEKSTIQRYKYFYKYSNLWILMYYVYSKIYDFLFKNILVLILFLPVFVISFYRVIKSKFMDKNMFIVFILCLLYILNLIVITFTHSLSGNLRRYINVSEFFVYLAITFYFYDLLKSLKYFRKTNRNANNT